MTSFRWLGQHQQWELMVTVCTLDVMFWEGQFTSVAFSWKPITSVELWEKHQENPIEGQSTKYLASNTKSRQGHQKQGKSGKLSSQEESKDTWQLNVIYPRWDPGTEEGHQVNTKKTRINY